MTKHRDWVVIQLNDGVATLTDNNIMSQSQNLILIKHEAWGILQWNNTDCCLAQGVNLSSLECSH